MREKRRTKRTESTNSQQGTITSHRNGQRKEARDDRTKNTQKGGS